MLSGRGLCDELITRPEESYRLWCVVVCDLETSRMGAPCIYIYMYIYIYIYTYIYDISSLRGNSALIKQCKIGLKEDVVLFQTIQENAGPRSLSPLLSQYIILYRLDTRRHIRRVINSHLKNYTDKAIALLQLHVELVWFSSKTSALEGDEWSASRPGRTLPPGKTRYPLYRGLGGPQGRSGWAENIAPTGIRSSDRPVRSQIFWTWLIKFYIFLTMHLRIVLVGNHLDVQFLL